MNDILFTITVIVSFTWLLYCFVHLFLMVIKDKKEMKEMLKKNNIKDIE